MTCTQEENLEKPCLSQWRAEAENIAAAQRSGDPVGTHSGNLRVCPAGALAGHLHTVQCTQNKSKLVAQSADSARPRPRQAPPLLPLQPPSGLMNASYSPLSIIRREEKLTCEVINTHFIVSCSASFKGKYRNIKLIRRITKITHFAFRSRHIHMHFIPSRRGKAAPEQRPALFLFLPHIRLSSPVHLHLTKEKKGTRVAPSSPSSHILALSLSGFLMRRGDVTGNLIGLLGHLCSLDVLPCSENVLVWMETCPQHCLHPAAHAAWIGPVDLTLTLSLAESHGTGPLDSHAHGTLKMPYTNKMARISGPYKLHLSPLLIHVLHCFSDQTQIQRSNDQEF